MSKVSQLVSSDQIFWTKPFLYTFSTCTCHMALKSVCQQHSWVMPSTLSSKSCLLMTMASPLKNSKTDSIPIWPTRRPRSRGMKWLIQSHAASWLQIVVSDLACPGCISVGSPERRRRAGGVWSRTVTGRRRGRDGGSSSGSRHSNTITRSLSLQHLAQLSSVLASFLERLSLCLATPAEKEHLFPNTSSMGPKTGSQWLRLGMCLSRTNHMVRMIELGNGHS